MSEFDHWFVRLTRFASAHLVRSQDDAMSCAMASCVMINFKVKKGLMAAGVSAGGSISTLPFPGASYVGYSLARAAVRDAIRTESEVRPIYEAVAGESTHDWSVDGAMPDNLDDVLQRLRLGRWETVDVGENGVAQALIDSTDAGWPVLIACYWDGGGGHALVCDQTHSFLGRRYLCICDPWDGELRLISCTPGSPVAYDATYRPVSLTFGGTRRAYSPGQSMGRFRGTIIRHVT